MQPKTKEVIITCVAELIFYGIDYDNVGYDILCDIVIMLCTCYRPITVNTFVEILSVFINVLYVYAFSEPK